MSHIGCYASMGHLSRAMGATDNRATTTAVTAAINLPLEATLHNTLPIFCQVMIPGSQHQWFDVQDF